MEQKVSTPGEKGKVIVSAIGRQSQGVGCSSEIAAKEPGPPVCVYVTHQGT